MTYQEKKALALSYLNNDEKQNDYRTFFTRIYPFSTENLTGFFNEDLVKDKKVLITGSSTDQIISAQLFGAKKITHFDINPFVEYMYNLKMSAIKELEPYEFLDYFYYNFENLETFRYRTYEKIRKNLAGESLDFWDTLYSNSSPLKIRRRLFILNNEEERNKYKYILPYMFNNKYQNLKNMEFVPVDFKFCNILKLSKVLDEKYDMIYFSNIFNREEMINFYTDYNYIERVSDFMRGILEHTEIDGKILLNYFYDMRKSEFLEGKNRMINYYIKRAAEEFNCEDNISCQEVPSIDDYSRDTILIYTKKKH